MDTHVNDIESQVLSLDPSSRARLAVRLIRSIDQGDQLTIDQAEEVWLHEADERLRRLESGVDEEVPAKDAIAAAREQLHS